MKKILIADGDADNLYTLKMLFERNGFEVALANEGTQAREHLNREQFDLIISDVILDGITGLALCDECSRNPDYKNVPFLFYTGGGMETPDEELALRLGASKYINNYLEPDEILEVINELLDPDWKDSKKAALLETQKAEFQTAYDQRLIKELENQNAALRLEISESREIDPQPKSVSDDNFETIFKRAAVGVCEVDCTTLKFVKTNQKFCEIVDYTVEELSDLTFEDLVHPEDFSSGAVILSQLISGEIREFSKEKRYLRKGGQIVWANVTVSPTWKEGEEPATVIAVTQEITTQKLVEEEFRESEQRLRTILDTGPDCIKIIGQKGELLDMNPAGLEMIEADEFEQVRGKLLLDLVLPEYQSDFAALTKRVLNGEEASLEFEIEGLKGNRRWLSTKATPLRKKEGGIESILGVTRDITDQKGFEAALVLSEDRYRDLVENSPFLILTHDLDGIVLSANLSVVEKFGYSLSEIEGMNFRDMVLEEFLPDYENYLDELRENGRAEGLARLKTKTGSVRIWEYTNTVRTEGVKDPVVRAIATDVTHRRESATIIAGQKLVLEMVALGSPLSDTLLKLLSMTEELAPEMICSIFLFDEPGAFLHSGVSPNLPSDYIETLNGTKVGEGVGSCGTAAFRGETVIVRDIRTDPLWAEYRDDALKFGLLACWSAPIRDAAGNVLGTFAIYYKTATGPTPRHIRLVELATGSAAIAITHSIWEERLRNNERRLNIAQAAARIGDWQFDVNSQQIVWSDTLYDIFGRDPAGGTPSFEEHLAFYEDEDSRRLKECVELAVTTGKGYSLDLKVKGDTDRFISAIGQPVLDENGSVIKLYGTGQEITERKIAEDSIRFQAHLLDAVRQAVIAVDIEGKIVYWNQFASTLYGWPGDDVIGRDIYDVIMPDLSRDNSGKLLADLIERKSWNGEMVFSNKSGEQFSVQLFVSAVYDNQEVLIGLVGISLDITERKRSESALQKSEERLRILFDHMIDGFYYSTKDGRLIDINPSMVEMFGYSSRDEMLKVDVAKDLYFDPADRKKRTSTTEAEKSDIYRMRRKDGSEIWVEDNGRYIYDDDGQILFHEGVLRDVTERMRAEELIKDANERLALSQLIGKIGSFEWNIRSNAVFWSPVQELLYGLQPGEFADDFENWKRLVHPDDLQVTNDRLQVALETGDYSVEFRIIRPDKELRWIQARAEVFYGDDGKPLRIVGVNLDVTDRKNAENAIAEANGRAIMEYENLLGILGELARTFGTARNIDAIFHAIIKFTSATVPCSALIISLKKDQVRREPIFFWHGDSVRDVCELSGFPVAENLAERAMETGEVLISDILTDDRNQELKSTLIAPMKIKGDVIGAIEVYSIESEGYANAHKATIRMMANLAANAIENVRLLELEIQRAEQVKRSQKLESVGRLAGGIAHDFNNMLTAINGYSELALKRLDVDDPIRSNIIEIKKAGERSADLTRQLLAFSRQQVLQLKHFNLNEIINDIMMLLRRLIGENLDLQTKLSADLGSIESDPGQFSQIVINLAVNARDAMPNGGQLTIETTNVSVGPLSAGNYPGLPGGEYVLMTIADTGIGMDKELLKKIFEPFFTTKVVGKGTGLGLATVYGFIRQSDGHIFVESRVKEGTTFSIYMPRVDIPAPETKKVKDEAMKGRKTETILIVEDEDMVRALTRQVLEESGYKIIEAVNGVEALAICEDLKDEIDLVITDIIMPQMGGQELCERLSELRPDLPVIFTSGYTDDANLSEYIVDEDANFLGKPFTFDELVEKVEKFLDSESGA